jgi:hypothetical protein
VSFEAEFFGPGNRLRWDAICAGSLAADVKARLGPFLDVLRRAPDMLVLPRVREDDGRVQWYVLCSSARGARVVRDELRAFLGPSYSDFEGLPTELDPSDGVEAAVLSRCGSTAFRLEVPQRELFDAARERLLLLTRLRDERPVRTARRFRAAGRVLRDFEYALIGNDVQATAECLEELRTSSQLGATNLLFLEVRRLAALGQWNAILVLPELGSLLAMSRPRRVTEALIRAVYAMQLQEFERGLRGREALDRFQSEVLSRFRDLFRTHAGLSGYEVDASFLLASAASDPPRRDVVEAVLARNPEGSAGHLYLAALARLVPVRTAGMPRSDTLTEAHEAFAVADIDRAYEIAIGLSPSFEGCALLIRCAREMGTLAAAHSALGAVDRLSETEKTRLNEHAILRRIRDGLSALSISATAEPTVGTTVPGIPTSWSAWLRRLLQVEPWNAAVAVAEMGAREWNLEALLASAAAVGETAELVLEERPAWGQAALRDALPHLLEFVLSRGIHLGLKPIYENLFLAIAVDEQVSLPQVSALIRVADTRLQLGVSRDEYKEILAQLASALDNAGSPAVADLALEALDTLVTEACPDSCEREDFVARVAAIFQRWYRRIDVSQWALLRQLADELRVPDAVGRQVVHEHVAGAYSLWTDLHGKKVALYSLREAPLRRVQLLLRALCPSIRVDVFSDRVGGSPALRTASATADVFVVATAAAKHAATLYIDANRPSSLITLYARGQGSASLLEAIRDFLKQPNRGKSLDVRGG